MSSLLIMGGLAAFFAVILCIASKYLYVQEDPLVEKLLEVLPGVNCGACGFPNCLEFSKALVAGKDSICKAGGSDISVELAKVLGKDIGESSSFSDIAIIHCGSSLDTKKKRAEYRGVESCLAANSLSGDILCQYGCLGFGDCASVCPVDAITVNNGLAVIDPVKCIGCGKCVSVCPRGIIELIKWDKKRNDRFYIIACSNPEIGKSVMQVCDKGCIGCQICVKTASHSAFSMDGFLAKIDYSYLSDCEKAEDAMNKCPKNTIQVKECS